MKTSKKLKDSGSVMSFNSKKQKKIEKVESGIKLEEEELNMIRAMLTKREIKELDLKNIKKSTKNQVLKPLSKEKTKRHTSVILTDKSTEELAKTYNEKTSEWKPDSSQLDDYQFRKTLTKKNEKIIIDDYSKQSLNENEFKELAKFLTILNLMKYYDVFLENCFDDLYSISEIKETHLEEMKVPPEDRKIILEEIDKLKTNDNINLPNSLRIENFPNNKKYESKSDTAVGSDDYIDEINKFEEEERRLFQKALEDYRNSINNNIKIVKEDNSIKSHTKMDQGVSTLGIEGITNKKRKLSCWECYKIKTIDNMILSDFIQNKVLFLVK